MTLDDVRELALSLPRSYEALVRGRVKFRVGQIVYLAFSDDCETMGFGFPKELRDALVQSEPHKFSWQSESDMRFNWVHVSLGAIEADEMRDLVENAWAMCVPKRVAAEYAASRGYESGPRIPMNATIVRGVLLPASMKLLGDWNWYLPSWLEWLPHLGVSEGEADLREADAAAPVSA